MNLDSAARPDANWAGNITFTARDFYRPTEVGDTVLATLGTYSNLSSTGGYNKYSFSLVPYIGQKITLKFTGKETLNNGDNTSFFEDDNALNVS